MWPIKYLFLYLYSDQPPTSGGLVPFLDNVAQWFKRKKMCRLKKKISLLLLYLFWYFFALQCEFDNVLWSHCFEQLITLYQPPWLLYSGTVLPAVNLTLGKENVLDPSVSSCCSSPLCSSELLSNIFFKMFFTFGHYGWLVSLSLKRHPSIHPYVRPSIRPCTDDILSTCLCHFQPPITLNVFVFCDCDTCPLWKQRAWSICSCLINANHLWARIHKALKSQAFILQRQSESRGVYTSPARSIILLPNKISRRSHVEPKTTEQRLTKCLVANKTLIGVL